MVVGLEEENMIIYHEKIRVDDFLSPYCTTVVLPNHQQGKHILKADMIFEEFIGIDLHHKVEMNEQVKSDVTAKLGAKKSSSFLPPEVSPLKDTTRSTKVAKEQSNQSKPNKKLDEMPSFNLIDNEEPEEGFDDKTTEDDCRIIEDDCRILSGLTIFDHIRRKAKNFPLVAKSNAISFGTSESSNLPTKLFCVDQHASPNKLEFSEEFKGSDDQEQMVTSERQHHDLFDNGDATACLGTSNVSGSTGIIHPQIDVNKKESRRVNPILDHVRKRSKYCPVINEPNVKERSSPGAQGHFSDKEQTQSHMTVDSQPILDPVYNVSSPMGTFKDSWRASSTASRSLDLPFEVFNIQPNSKITATPYFDDSLWRKEFQTNTSKPSPNDLLPRKELQTGAAKQPPNDSLMRKEFQFEPPADSKELKSNNTLNHLREANRGSCSLETAVRNRNAESYLGFKSVFSFL